MTQFYVGQRVRQWTDCRKLHCVEATVEYAHENGAIDVVMENGERAGWSGNYSNIEPVPQYDAEISYHKGVLTGLNISQEHIERCPRCPWGSMPGVQSASAMKAAIPQEPVAYEFLHPNGHAVVDYTANTHVGHLTPENGYVAIPLVYASTSLEIEVGK